MRNKYFLLFASFCSYLCFLGFLLLLKKPFCIDSTVVHKIDRVSAVGAGSTTETLYACSLNRVVEYSTELDEKLQKMVPILDRTVLFLESIKPFQNKIQIALHEDRPLLFQVDKNKIALGIEFLNLDHHLSRAVIKTWINENKNSLLKENLLVEESLTDLILYALTGKVELEDPVDRTRTKLGSVKWPQVIKTTKSYCLSAWKFSEHTELCTADDSIGDSQAIIYSLRPLLTSSLISGYNEMSFKQQGQLLQRIPLLLSQSASLEKNMSAMMTESNPLRQGMNHVNQFTDFILSSAKNQQGEVFTLYTGLMQHLQQYGVSDSFTEAYFDYIFEFDGVIDMQSAIYKNLQTAAVKNAEKQVALKDKNGIRILPSRTALPLETFNRIQSQQTILMSCDYNKNIRLENFFNKTEKLMLINNCDQDVAYDFDSLLRQGIKAFISSNQKFSFIQLHVASVEMIQSKLSLSQNFFDLVKNHEDMSRKEFKVLGWSHLHWKKDMQAYRPEAVVEAIEYFRN